MHCAVTLDLNRMIRMLTEQQYASLWLGRPGQSGCRQWKPGRQSVAILAAPEQAVGVRVAYIKNVVGKASLVNKSSLVTAAISVIAI